MYNHKNYNYKNIHSICFIFTSDLVHSSPSMGLLGCSQAGFRIRPCISSQSRTNALSPKGTCHYKMDD